MHASRIIETVSKKLFLRLDPSKVGVEDVYSSGSRIELKTSVGRTSITVVPADRRDQAGPRFFDHEIVVESTSSTELKFNGGQITSMNAASPMCIAAVDQGRLSFVSQLPVFSERSLVEDGIDAVVESVCGQLSWMNCVSKSGEASAQMADDNVKAVSAIHWQSQEQNCAETESWIERMGFCITSRSFTGISVKLPPHPRRKHVPRELRLRLCRHPALGDALHMYIAVPAAKEHSNDYLYKRLASMNAKECKLPSAVCRVAAWGLDRREVGYGTVLSRHEDWWGVATLILYSMLRRFEISLPTEAEILASFE